MKSWFRSALVLSAGLVVGVAAATVGLGSASAAPAAPGSSSSPGKTPTTGHSPNLVRPGVADTLFVPLTPCRIVDTRSGGGKIALNGTRSFHAISNSGLASQGGSASGCGVAFGATAIATNVTVTQASTNGYMSAYPFGATEPNTNFTTYYGDRDVTSNPEIPLGGVGGAYDFTVHNHGGATHLIVDVTGYYIPQIEAFVKANGDLFNATPRVIVVNETSAGVYDVGLDTNVEACSVVVTPGDGNAYGSAVTDQSVVVVHTWVLNTSHDVTPTDEAFNLVVSC